MCKKCEVSITEQVAALAQDASCTKCRGRGWVPVGPGYTENGQYRGKTGVCFACRGRKVVTAADVRRNQYYHAHYWNPPVVA
jgi:hypothetical protein